MQKIVPGLLFVSTVGLTSLLAQDKKPPLKLVLPAKNGNIAFDHSAHVKHEKTIARPATRLFSRRTPKRPSALSHRTKSRRIR
jgi:hypothetical protein